MRLSLPIIAGAVLATAPISAAAEEALLFQETFSGCTSTTIQGGYFTESLYFDCNTMGDNTGWHTENVYMAERAVKFSAKTKHGTAATPVINLAQGAEGNVTVRFRAQSWTGDNLYLHVDIDGEQTQTIDLDGSGNVSDRNQDMYELNFTDISDDFVVNFTTSAKPEGTGVRRLFLADVIVTQEVSEAAPWIKTNASYHHFDNRMAETESETRYVRARNIGSQAALEAQLEADSHYRLVSVAEDNGDTVFGFGFDPYNAGVKEETVLITDGVNSRRVVLNGTAKVYRPEISDASQTSADSFTANWPAAAGMDQMELVVWTVEKAPLVAPTLMITKYIEGKSSNRALEIFNGTGRDMELMGWYLIMEANGAGGLTKSRFDLPDECLDNGACYTLCDANFKDVRDIADKTIGFQDGGYENIMTFTGDDAIGLFNPAGELVDLVGYESIDVNDRVSGVWGTDVSYYRRPDCYEAHPKFYVEEWTAYPMDTHEGFGAHQMDAEGPVRNIVARMTLDGKATSAVVEGLEAEQEYHYAVRGLSNGLYTHYSPEAIALTKASGVAAAAGTKAWNMKGGVLTLAEGATAWSVDGRMLQGHAIALDGHGVVIVRAADGTASKVAF